MQVQFRALPGPTEVPDQPLGPTTTGGFARADATTDTHTALDHTAFDFSAMRAEPVMPTANAILSDWTPPSASISWFAHADALPQFVAAASLVADGHAAITVPGASDAGGTGGGEIARGSDGLLSAMNSFDYSDHGWFIVPSATNEYGDAVYAAGDGFSFDVASGDFASDFFIV